MLELSIEPISQTLIAKDIHQSSGRWQTEFFPLYCKKTGALPLRKLHVCNYRRYFLLGQPRGQVEINH
jgi:hypothetical protein